MAYETQKTINKQLELELQDEKAKFKAYEKEFRLEIEKLRDDNERQQKLLSANLSTSPQSQTEAFMQHEITRLTTENLDLHDKNETLSETVRKLQKQIKLLTRKLKEGGLEFDDNLVKGDDKKDDVTLHNRLPLVRKKETEYLGMFSFKSGDEDSIMKKLVVGKSHDLKQTVFKSKITLINCFLELNPRTAITLLPGLPAYIIFMCLRHTDYINDEDKVRVLLSSFINSVKKVIRKRQEDFESLTLWLSNVLR